MPNSWFQGWSTGSNVGGSVAGGESNVNNSDVNSNVNFMVDDSRLGALLDDHQRLLLQSGCKNDDELAAKLLTQFPVYGTLHTYTNTATNNNMNNSSMHNHHNQSAGDNAHSTPDWLGLGEP
jgi:hypothetical protein